MKKWLHNNLMKLALNLARLAVRVTGSGVRLSSCHMTIEGNDKQRKAFFDLTCEKFEVITLPPENMIRDYEVWH